MVWCLLWTFGCGTAPIGTPDEPARSTAVTGCDPRYADRDGDGWGRADDAACDGDGAPYSALLGGDCDDADATVHPDAAERCDDLDDDDCDGAVDEAGALGCTERWGDADGDGYGGVSLGCVCAADGAARGGDCDDDDDATFPGAAAAEAALCARDDDGDGYGAAAAPAGTDPGTDCDDDDASSWPGAPAPCNDGVDQACDGGASCRIDDLLLNTGADMLQPGPEEGDLVGQALAACDLDADGVDEVVAGAPLMYRSSGGTLLFADRAGSRFGSVTELDGGEAAGWAVACGDLDGDGVPDVLSSRPGAFEVRLLPGGDPAAATALDGLVRALALGDRDGDGAREAYGGVTSALSTLDGSTGRFENLVVDADGTGFGGALALGDVDGDGLDDLVVGAPQAQRDAGAVHLFLGASGAPAGAPDTADAVWRGDSGQEAGVALTVADLDADGFGDAVVGSGAGDTTWVVRGAGSLGSVSLSGADATWTSPRIGDQVGAALAAPGDIDQDGFADVLLGAPAAQAGGGAAWWVPGAPLLATGDADEVGVALRGQGPSHAAAGTALAGGDVDGDGFVDLLIGAPGQDAGAVYVVFGAGR